MMIQAVPPPPFRDPALLEILRSHVRASDPAASTLPAVTLLLAALEVGQNIDRLARYTGLSRSFVAQGARRLIDNGVWRNGQTICDWQVEGVAHPGFWNDVAVAEGKLCRRIDERGMIEWAPPGSWRKSYDFITPEPLEELNVQYQVPDAGEPGGAETSEVEPEDESRTEAAPTEVQDPAARTPRRRSRKSARQAPVARQPVPYGLGLRGSAGHPPPVRESTPQNPPPPRKLPELFPDAVWLR